MGSKTMTLRPLMVGIAFASGRSSELAPPPDTELGRAIAAGIRSGDRILIDSTCYGVPGLRWCRVTRLAHGTASVYPIKYEVPGRGEGQCKVSEVKGHEPRRSAR